MHVIFTCVAAWAKDREGGETFRSPGLPGKTALKCPAYFDLVLHMESRGDGENNERVWRTFHDGRIIAKDATGILGKFEKTDWTHVFHKILGTRKKESK